MRKKAAGSGKFEGPDATFCGDNVRSAVDNTGEHAFFSLHIDFFSPSSRGQRT
jgi:hypothetical protein